MFAENIPSPCRVARDFKTKRTGAGRYANVSPFSPSSRSLPSPPAPGRNPVVARGHPGYIPWFHGWICIWPRAAWSSTPLDHSPPPPHSAMFGFDAHSISGVTGVRSCRGRKKKRYWGYVERLAKKTCCPRLPLPLAPLSTGARGKHPFTDAAFFGCNVASLSHINAPSELQGSQNSTLGL